MPTTPNFGFPIPEDTAQVANGPEIIRALGNAVDAQFAVGFQFVGTRFFTSDGTFVKADPLGTGDIGLRAIRVQMVGGGGGGGGVGASGATTTAAASGGGGGVFAEKFILASALAASETVTRGAGGAGGAGVGASTAGGTSEFGTLLTAGGGGAGISTTAGIPPRIRTANAPSTASTGADFVVGGASGDPGFALDGFFIPGMGGASAIAPPSNKTIGTAATLRNGPPGILHGGGGSGGGNGFSQLAANGGNGANGIVIVDCFV